MNLFIYAWNFNIFDKYFIYTYLILFTISRLKSKAIFGTQSATSQNCVLQGFKYFIYILIVNHVQLVNMMRVTCICELAFYLIASKLS